MKRYPAPIQTRIEQKTKDKFSAIALQNKRKTADYLRLLIEQHVESSPQRRQLAGK